MSRTRALIALLVVALLAPAVSAQASPAAVAPETSTPSLTTAVVRVTVDITSPWSTVTFSGRLGGIHVLALSGASSVRRLPNGFTASGVSAAGARIVFDAVLNDTTSSVPWVSVEKGYTGATRVRLENRSDSPFQVLDAVNTTKSTTDPTNRRVFSMSRQRLFGARSFELPTVATEPLALAFYHPWFNDAVYADPTLADRPIDRSDSWDLSDVVDMSNQARTAGIDGFVVSWAGQAYDQAGFTQVIRAAKATGGVAAGLLEAVAANSGRDADQPADAAVAERWLRELLLFSVHPSYLKHEGVPVVFVYQMRRLPPAAWQGMLDRLAADGVKVKLVSDAGPGWANVSWGDFNYGPWGDDQGFRTMDAVATSAEGSAFESRSFAATRPARGARLVAGTAFPGYDDRLLRGDDRPTVARNGTATYEASWTAAGTANPDWMLVTSWNEWWEGTTIQPSDLAGSAALDATRPLVDAFKAAARGS